VIRFRSASISSLSGRAGAGIGTWRSTRRTPRASVGRSRLPRHRRARPSAAR